MKRLILFGSFIVIAVSVVRFCLPPEMKHTFATTVAFVAIAALGILALCSLFRVWEDTSEWCLGLVLAVFASGALYFSWPHSALPQMLRRTTEAVKK